MTERRDCGRVFEESLLTGYLDGALTQGDRQRVRLHVEDCSSCRAQVEQMRQLREATMSTEFRQPDDDQWDERPRGALSRLTAGLGMSILVAWLVGLSGFAIGQLWGGPEGLIEKLLAFGAISGFVLLFLSVLIDRMRTVRSDPYRGVKK